MKYSEVEKIQTREDFISFLRALKKDHIEKLSSWENRDIEAFLGAMASWLEDMDGFYKEKFILTCFSTLNLLFLQIQTIKST